MTDTAPDGFTVSKPGIGDDAGKLILRVTLAGLMLFHGYSKVTGGIGGIESMLDQAGLPSVFAWGVYVGEVIAPLFMIAGVLTRISALIFAFNMVVAILLGHAGEMFTLGEHGEWAIELQMLYLMGAVAVALLGPGRYALRAGRGILA
ncbi:DoxX family protein [Roseiconus nitratireducens]|uniref:DoxX family protein n=1 Tax=Roseiconus nitratireducens TaxID=2605748 RepID=A0A5M6D8D6_9BACT|nr:DoxX family protein [Roseiconus nitratireducens]KAA5542572.1 DoxX family protein [Roseiconus nitratireducens]